MRRRPFYRWKSFWLGVVVLCFLGWAWARSLSRTEGVRVVWGMRYYTLQLYDEVVTVEQWDAPAGLGLTPQPPGWIWFSALLKPEDLGVQEEWVLFTRNSWSPAYLTWIAFPVSAAFRVCLVMWGGWLLWHGRRRRVSGEEYLDRDG